MQISVMQTELRTMRDFRRKRAELQEQLETLQETLDETKFMHKQQMTALEEKFFEEKVYTYIKYISLKNIYDFKKYSCACREKQIVALKSLHQKLTLKQLQILTRKLALSIERT